MDHSAKFQTLTARDGVFLAPVHPSLRPLAWTRTVCLVLAGALLLIAAEGHIYGISRLYAPAGDAALSLPTLLAGVGALSATLLQRPLRRSDGRETLIWILLISLCLLTGLGYRAGLTVGEGRMGGNTAVSFVLLAGGQLCYRRLPLSSFALTLMTLLLPFVAALGYLNGQKVMFGEMSLSTSVLLLALGIANLSRHARRAMLRPLVSGSASGRIVRGILMAWLLLVAAQAVSVRFVEAPWLELSSVTLMLVDTLVMLAAILFLGGKYDASAARLRLTEWRLYRAAMRDPATGMQTSASAELFSATFGPLTSQGLVMFEIEGIDALESRYGRPSSDRILRIVSTCLRRDLEAEELLCRGEDKGLLLLARNCTLDMLNLRAQELCARASELRDPDRELLPISVSAAVVMVRRGDGDLGPALRRAKEALESARTEGERGVILCAAA